MNRLLTQKVDFGCSGPHLIEPLDDTFAIWTGRMHRVGHAGRLPEKPMRELIHAVIQLCQGRWLEHPMGLTKPQKVCGKAYAHYHLTDVHVKVVDVVTGISPSMCCIIVTILGPRPAMLACKHHLVARHLARWQLLDTGQSSAQHANAASTIQRQRRRAHPKKKPNSSMDTLALDHRMPAVGTRRA